MHIMSRMAVILVLAIIFAVGIQSDGFAFDLTQRHSEEVPHVADAFSKSWLVEAQKQFDSDHSNGSWYLFGSLGIAILFIAYSVGRLGRASGVRIFSSKSVRHGIAQPSFEFRLICRWGGALAAPILLFRRITPTLLTARSRLSPYAS